MNKLLCILITCLVTISSAWAGTVIESLHLASKILHREVKYSIYLPSDYETSHRTYPVLYLLHGLSDNEASWIHLGNVKEIVDEAIEDHRAIPMIIVMPDAGETFYMNANNGNVRYEDMFVQEFIPYIEQTYRAKPAKESRAVAGLSMGGFGSFLYSLHHPELFAACAPLSAAVLPENISERIQDETHNRLFDKLYGGKNVQKHWDDNNIIHLVKELPIQQLTQVKYYIDCGDEDAWLRGNYGVHEVLMNRKVNHEFRVRDGGHCWTYWRTALPAVLSFVSAAFNRS